MTAVETNKHAGMRFTAPDTLNLQQNPTITVFAKKSKRVHAALHCFLQSLAYPYCPRMDLILNGMQQKGQSTSGS
jgi:hypothetical protein